MARDWLFGYGWAAAAGKGCIEMTLLGSIKRFGRPLKPYLRIASSAFFSQYGEDALLFLTMKPSNHGFYVDVGAYHPIDGSNTYKLYLRGWRGLTIEPNPKVKASFRGVRGGDTHLTMGVSPEPGALTYYEFEISMLNTMVSERAESLRQEGYVFKKTQTIACEPLNDILANHGAGRHVDLLSVDCEGFDLSIIQSLDFGRYRPTAILIEDLEAYFMFRDNGGKSEIERCMRESGYAPIAQAVYSTLYVANDWRELNRKTGAYTERMIYPGLLPEPMADSHAPPVTQDSDGLAPAQRLASAQAVTQTALEARTYAAPAGDISPAAAEPPQKTESASPPAAAIPTA